MIEQLPLIREYKMPFIAVWSSADQIMRNDMQPNFVFRVSLRDSLAMPFMLDHAAKRARQMAEVVADRVETAAEFHIIKHREMADLELR